MEDGAPGDEDVGAGGGRPRRGLPVDASVDLELDRQPALVDGAPGGGELVEHRRDEGLPAEAGVHAHEEEDVDLLEVREHRFDRRLGVVGEPDAQAELAHRREERPRVAELDVHGAPVGTRVGEVLEELPRIVDHEVTIEVEVGALAQRLHDRWPDREVGHEVAVHHVDVEEVRLGGDAFDVVGELGEVGRQDRRRDLGPGHGITLCAKQS